MNPRSLLPLLAAALLATAPLFAQPAPPESASRLNRLLGQLRDGIDELKQTLAKRERPIEAQLLADVEVCAKAADWILRHEEFFRPAYLAQTERALKLGQDRAAALRADQPDWFPRTGTTVLGYYSKVDGSVQPYALTLPPGVDPKDGRRWPLHVVLHGRANQMNEVNFISRHERKESDEDQDWIQLDVYGRGNNAYRWAGETDVFEAIADVQRRVRIDDRRITLHGFSMGGAGAWHLGLHYPCRWSSVGTGAGFVDTYKYQKIQRVLPEYQDRTLSIYDAEKYALNTFNVPVVTYGGELDNQLVASTTMVEAAKEHGIELKFILGKGAGHKFTPEGLREFMAFHREKTEQGRPAFPGPEQLRFVTYTPKYNACDWLTIEELEEMYRPAVVEGKVDADGTLDLTTQNVAALQLARDIAPDVRIDGQEFPLLDAAGGLLPGVYFRNDDGWELLGYDESRGFMENTGGRKRHDLQGPIDDAFMQPFVCVLPSGEPWSPEHDAWARWTLDRFDREFDKWMRGRVPTVNDSDLTDEQIASRNLVLFGDPGSNRVLARIVDRLPVRWTKEAIEVQGRKYDPATHGLSLIFPNPLNPQRYVVINSGHTFHEREFKASNAQLYPRLGDIAVQRFEKQNDGGYKETVEWAAIFDSSWRLPEEQ